MSRIFRSVAEIKKMVALNIINLIYNKDRSELIADCEVVKLNSAKRAREYYMVVCNGDEWSIDKVAYIQSLDFEYLCEFGTFGLSEMNRRVSGLVDKLENKDIDEKYKTWVMQKLGEYSYKLEESKEYMQDEKFDCIAIAALIGKYIKQ